MDYTKLIQATLMSFEALVSLFVIYHHSLVPSFRVLPKLVRPCDVLNGDVGHKGHAKCVAPYYDDQWRTWGTFRNLR